VDLLDVSRADLASVTVEVQYDTDSNEDFVLLYQNLFDTALTTLYLGDIWAPGVDLSFSALDISACVCCSPLR